MFCSNCGKTIRPEDQVCSFCQAPIGDNRFGGIPYTSAQFTIAPGQTSFEPLNNYTRTTYTSMEDANQEGGEVDSRTTYRPVYEGASAPVDVRRDMRAAFAPEPEEAEEPVEEEIIETGISPDEYSQTAQVVLSELDEDLRPDEEIDRSQFRSRPIQSVGRAGISRDVSEYIRKLEDDQSRRGARRRRAAEVYDDYAERDTAVYEEEEYQREEAYAAAPAADPDNDEYYGDEYADGEYAEDDYEYDEDRGPRFNVGNIIKIAVAVVLLGLLIWGVIAVVGNVKKDTSSAPIEGVTEALYIQGVELIKSQADTAYVNELIGIYKTNGLLPVTNRLMEDKNAINALTPAEPAVNDSTFISALQTIHANIENAVTMDVLAVDVPSATNAEDSQNRWQIVNNSIAQLEGATSAAELTAIINGQKITVQAQTPEPSPTPKIYTPLSNGDKGDEVLELQNRLYELGYLNDDRDGAFGGKTQTALKKFQERMGLDASGIADQQTQSMLYSDSALYAEGAVTPSPAPTATPEPVQEDLIAPAEAISGEAA